MSNLIQILNSGGEKFVDFALPMLIQSSVLIVILLAIDLLLRKKVRATFRYWLWMLVLVKLVLPPSLWSPVSFGNILGQKIAAPVTNFAVIAKTKTPAETLIIKPSPAPEEEKAIAMQKPILSDTPVEVSTAATADKISSGALSWQAIVLVVWVAAAGAMALLVIQRVFFVLGLIRQARLAQGLLTETFEFCRKRIGVNLLIKLKVSANATSPAVCGLIRPVILVPQDIGPSLGPGHLRPVLMHELSHIKRGDLWVNLLQTVLQIIYFYNPLLWLANAVIRRAREQAVDEMVQVAMAEKAEQYPETLLSVAKLAFNRPALALRFIGVVESKSQLQNRIKKMLNQPIPKTAKLGITGLLVIILTGAALLPMATAQKENQSSYTRITAEKAKELVEDFFNHNYRDITARETIEWGEPEKDKNGNVSIRYKYEAVIWGKDKIIENKVFTFDENGEFISAKNLPGFPVKNGTETIVERVVLTISTCPEADPRVAEALESLDGLNEDVVIKKLVEFLQSDKNTVRRAALYILWHGNFENIKPAVDEVITLCKHEEEFTRGMAALTLGANKQKNSFDALCEMTLDDQSSYARRCAAYALGLLGMPQAEPTLKTALKDPDFNVRNNAEAAMTMISQQEKYNIAGDTNKTETDKTITLKHDDGKSAGKWSFSGGGHGVKFLTPSDGCILKAVQLYGSRYGDYEPPDEDFDIWVCDKNFKIIKNFKFPYSTFAKRGYTKWVTLDVDDVEVPRQFAICAAFDPHQTKGIYIYHDAKSSRHSYQGIPPEMEPFKDGNWLIRAIVETPGDNTTSDAAPSRADRMEAEDLTGEGWKLWGARKLTESEDLFKQAVQKDPKNANAWNGLGWSQQNQGKNLHAQDSFSKCLEIEPDHAAALNGMGWIEKSQGNTDQAIEYWEKAVKVSGGQATASLSGLTRTYMELGQYDKAVKFYKMWLTVEPDNEQVKKGLAEAQDMQK